MANLTVFLASASPGPAYLGAVRELGAAIAGIRAVVALTGSNTYTGATTVAAGELLIRHAQALGTGAAGTTITCCQL